MSSSCIPDRAQPWLRAVAAELGLNAPEQQRCIDQASLLIGEVPVTWMRTLTGGDTQLAALAIVGPIGAPGEAAPTLEAVLQTQLLLCGPAMPVFGLDLDSRSLVLQHVFEVERDSAAQAVTMLRAMQRMATDSRALLPPAP
ncbi:hypothetical protein [Ideonella sp.]|uniref:hypothetical protein n=1 Tax=Ideonella sp. TaxID=1929293 RepID=UPI0035AFEF80